jgi:TRAP-type uncharacterized transport system substrate-binding protein
MVKHYTVTREGLSKVYENENIRLKVYPKQHQYFEPIATVKVGHLVWTSANISRADAARMVKSIREASKS